MFLSGIHSVTWRAHSRTYSIFLCGKHLVEVAALGKKNQRQLAQMPRNTSASGASGQHLNVLLSLKFMAKLSPRTGLIWIPGLFLGLGNCLFRQLRREKDFIFPSLTTSLTKERYFRNGKGMKNSTCPAKFLSLTRQKWILSHKFGKSFNVGVFIL